jgi:hypothetical protein
MLQIYKKNYKIPTLKFILIELGLNPSSWSENDMHMKFKRWKWPFCFWMELILLDQVYHMISSVLASPFLQGAAPCPLWLMWMFFSIPVTSS